MTERQERSLKALQRRKGWPMAERMLNALRVTTDRIPAGLLQRIGGCTRGQRYMVIGFVRQYLEDVEGTTLSNIRGVGYRIGEDIGDELDEAAKQAARMVSHGKRHGKTMTRISKKESEIKTLEDMKSYATHQQIQVMGRAMTELFERLNRGPLANLEREGMARQEAKAPLAEHGLSTGRDGEDEDLDFIPMMVARADSPKKKPIK